MKDSLLTNKPRIEVVDALRGFAVIAILLVHSLEHFIFNVYPDPLTQPNWLNILDQGVFNIIFALFAGKAYAIFALLFGFTYYIQLNNQRKKGKDFSTRFIWRLFLLFIPFATINAAFFPAGDVLLLFSIVGIALVLVRNWSNKAILITAIILLLQPVEWFHYFTSLVNENYTFPNLGIKEMYGEVGAVTKKGDFSDFIFTNVTLGQKASLFWAIGAGRFLQTAGLFLLGFLIGRKEYFVSNPQNVKFWVKVLIIAAILFCPLYQLKVLLYDNAEQTMINSSVGVILDMWQKFAFTFILVSSFVILYQKEKFQNLTSNLKLYGRMSLTNYLTQSIIGAFIYFPIGLYLAPYCGYTLSLLIGIVVLVLQVLFCKWWFQSHRQGPLEYIWGKLTWIGRGK